MTTVPKTHWDPNDSDEEIKVSMATINQKPEFAGIGTTLALGKLLVTTLLTIYIARDQLRAIDTSDAFKPTGLGFGDISPKGMIFAPLKVITHYASVCVNDLNRDKVRRYFKDTLHVNRVWDIFVHFDPNAGKSARSPLLLVPTAQFLQYLNIASRDLGINLSIPNNTLGDICYSSFGDFDTPRPRFLGRSNGAAAIIELKEKMHMIPAEDLSHLTPACLQDYKDKITEIYAVIESDAIKKHKKREKTRLRRIENQKEWGRMLKRTQRYLGLRQPVHNMSALEVANQPVWDVNSPPWYKPKDLVRFVCVDIEAYERQANVITEIGLAILDTDDSIDVAPGTRGESWFSLIEAHHFIIEEYTHLKNTEFLAGCPEAFHFGKSQTIPSNEISKIIGRIIGDNESKDKRPVIMVGHDIGQDLDYLYKIGYNPWAVSQIVDEVDTKRMYQRLERAADGRKLQVICSNLEIPGYDYHNAGNDAVYTLRAMITMAVKRAVEGSDRDEDSSAPASNEWSDGEMDDGGCSKRSAPRVPYANEYDAIDEWAYQGVRW
ncbi:hypothetical protein F5Y16DRAFT_395564 [Xylariaceae sp. FL0255]|nr:hypothetical protein F5Y16DRAFT_395564 [Xylariaceae sp. FL0255]